MMIDFKTKYLGLDLKSPLVVSASPLSEEVDRIARMEEYGAGAVVLFSLFEEQIRQENHAHDEVMASTNDAFAEASSYFPEAHEYSVGTETYLKLIEQAKQKVDIPIIGSLNGITAEGWIDFAQQIEQAGADALELNIFYIPTELDVKGEDVERRYIDILKTLKSKIQIPVAVKLSPYFSAMANMAHQLDEAGADALVLFNRFYQPDFDIENFKVISSLRFSSSTEIRLPLLWISALCGRLKASLAATTGVQGPTEAIKYLLAGADVVMITSALYRHGIPYLTHIAHGLESWMKNYQFDSVDQFRGILSQQRVEDPTAFDRANYIKILEAYK